MMQTEIAGIGFVIVDRSLLDRVKDDEEWFFEAFARVFVPRVSRSERIGRIHIVTIPDTQAPVDEALAGRTDRVQVDHCVDESGIVPTMRALVEAEGDPAVVVIDPADILASPVEIDRLVDFHSDRAADYSYNDRPAPGSRYPRGLGAEVFSARCFLAASARSDRHLFAFDETRRTVSAACPGAPAGSTGPDVSLRIEGPESLRAVRRLIDGLMQREGAPFWSAEAILKEFRTLNGVTTVVILEHEADVAPALSWGESAGGLVRYCSLSPLTSALLEARAIPHTTMIDYLDEDEYYAIGLDNYRILEEICDIVDDELKAVYDIDPIEPARDIFFYLKVLFDVLFTKTRVVEEIVKREKPDHVVAFAHPEAEPPIPKPFSDDDPLYAMILALSGWEVPISILGIDGSGTAGVVRSPGDQGSIRGRSALLRWLDNHAGFFNLAMVAKKKGVGCLARTTFAMALQRGGKSALIYESGYNWDDCLDSLCEAGFTTIYRLLDSQLGTCPPRVRSEYYEAILSLCRRNQRIRSSAYRGSRDTSPILFDRMAKIIAYSMEEAPAAFRQAEWFLREHAVQCLLLSTRVTPKGNAVVKAARSAGIPVVSWQHGAAGFMYHPIMRYVELRGSDVHLVFGEGVKANYACLLDAYPLPERPQLVTVGSSSLDLIKQHIRHGTQRSTRALYVTTNYLLNYFYLSFNRGEFDERLWQTQRQVISLFSRHPEWELVVKLHPSHTSKRPLEDYLRTTGARNIRLVVNEESIVDLYSESDLLLFDLVSTSILQACTSEKPILVCTELYAYDPDVLSMLGKRASTYGTAREFVSGIEDYLSGRTGASGVDTMNTEFLRQFGTDEDDGESGTRAAAGVKAVVERRSRVR